MSLLWIKTQRNQPGKSHTQKNLFYSYVKRRGNPAPDSWQLKCREINPDKVQHLSAVFLLQALSLERDEGQALWIFLTSGERRREKKTPKFPIQTGMWEVVEIAKTVSNLHLLQIKQCDLRSLSSLAVKVQWPWGGHGGSQAGPWEHPKNMWENT